MFPLIIEIMFRYRGIGQRNTLWKYTTPLQLSPEVREQFRLGIDLAAQHVQRVPQ
jgi:hypothetical protein